MHAVLLDDAVANIPGLARAALTRRQFLRAAGRGLAGILMLPLLDAADHSLSAQDAAVPEHGRVLDNSLEVFSKPSFSARIVKMYWHDVVVSIDRVTIGDQEPEHNRVWYRINDGEGYAHSGKVQPVAIQSNDPLEELPERGTLAEVTVPFTDARRDPDRPDRFAGRLYYSAVFWIEAMDHDQKGKTWYRVPDDKYGTSYYVNAEHLRPIPASELAPISAHIPAKEKWLEVRLAEQVVTAFEAGKPVFMARLSSGAAFRNGNYTTPAGTYQTNRKRPSRHMASGDLAAPNAYNLPGVPWVSYLTLSGISFHGTYWHNDFGIPRSHGCLNLLPQAAQWIYRWTAPAVPLEERIWEKQEGTRVVVIAA